MIRIATTVVCAAFLSACSSVPDWAAARQFLNGGARHTDVAQYSFDWQLSGERQVAPLQIFDDGRQTWLQFLPDQIVPAIFEQTPQGERLLSHVRQGDFIILDGVWPVLSFRGGVLSASAHKQQPNVIADVEIIKIPTADPDVHRVQNPDTASVMTPTVTPPATHIEQGHDAARQVVKKPAPAPNKNDGNADAAAVHNHSISDEARRLTDASFDAIPQDAYRIRLQDENLRKALHRWAARANWTFASEHWDVDVDIPISGEAVFQGTFQDAVQDVLASTELADRPLRPCFYSNRVLRVVAYAQSCDRSGARAS